MTALGQPIRRSGKMLMYIHTSCHDQLWSNTLMMKQKKSVAHPPSLSSLLISAANSITHISPSALTRPTLLCSLRSLCSILHYAMHMRFFFVQSYSHSAYIDYGGTLFYPVPVCRPGPKVGLDGRTTAHTLPTHNSSPFTKRANMHDFPPHSPWFKFPTRPQPGRSSKRPRGSTSSSPGMPTRACT